MPRRRSTTDPHQRQTVEGSGMMRRALGCLTIVTLTYVACGTASAPPEIRQEGRPAAAPATFDLEETTISNLQARMTSGQDTARSLVEKYTARIAQIDRQGPALRSVIELNPDAIS